MSEQASQGKADTGKTVSPPTLDGSPIQAQTATQPEAPSPWATVEADGGMSLPTVVADGGRSASGITGTPAPAPAPPEAPALEATGAPPSAPDATEPHTEAPEAPVSFVAQAEAERASRYKARTDDVRARQYDALRAENDRGRKAQAEMLTSDQVGEELRKDPFGFMRKHGIGVGDLNKEMDAGRAKDPENAVSKEVFELQQQVERTNQQLAAMQESTREQAQVSERSSMIATLSQGLTEYRESYPGLHAVFGGPKSMTSPAEQVLIGLERAQASGRPMSANEMAARLETEARAHYDTLTTAYQSGATAAPPQQQPPQVAPNTAGITNQVAAPVRVPGQYMSREEEINWAAGQLKFT